MCGIYGCIGINASEKVLEGLRKLEYRGYDSAGLAAIFPENDGQIKTEKTVGYVSDLVSKVNGRFKGTKISIGHTRWATHGEVTDYNAHPHTSNSGNITLVHNGIIENAMELSKKVKDLGYSFSSETDTEVIVHLLDYELSKIKKLDYISAFNNVMNQLEGSWAIAAIVTGLEGILISRNGAPLVLGKSDEDISIASDPQSFFGSCSEVAYIEDGDIFLVTSEEIISISNRSIPKFQILEGSYDEQNPGIFSTMMLKEINDQPTSLANVLSGRISADGKSAKLSGFLLSPDEIRNLDRINLVACGTAYYAAEIVSHYIRKYSNVRSEAFLSSEFPSKSVCSKKTLTIGISQSGETKDTLDALLDAKKHGSHISGICNVIGSTLARYSGNGAYLYAGPEYAVASTKVFTNMVAAGLLFALTISEVSDKERISIVNGLRKIPNLISKQLAQDDCEIHKAVDLIVNSECPIFIGRGGPSSYLAKEGALKLMEISYIPCLALPGGELKHGPIALLSPGSPVIAIAPSDDKLRLMESSIRECKSRGAKIILITDNDGPITQFADVIIKTNSTHPDLSPFVNIIPLQLIAYHSGLRKGTNVDRPRNLAKSVTVV